MIRRPWLLFVSLALALSLLAGCATQGGDGKKASDGDHPLSVALVLNGTLGDKGFFDSAARGIRQAGEELGVQYKIIEATYNPSEWEPALLAAASSGKYDMIITGTWQMTDIVKKAAQEYPNIKFVIFDEAVEGIPNVYSVRYAENEGSFLAGAFAAMLSGPKADSFPKSKGNKTVGFVGGMDIPVINNFRVGFEQGVAHVDPNTKVLVSYIGGFDDVAKGKELALAQFSQGADIVYNVAGNAGLGVLEASKEIDKYSIGVDMDQNPLYPGNTIISMLKNVDVSLFRAIKLHMEGALPYGKAETLGIEDNGIGLAIDEQYVPKEIVDELSNLIVQMKKGEIKVRSSLE
ncbi:MAG: BMP family ABC transporter substrate-binding protein [Hydrogenibacillus sp.]|nr:BMP family ABC transporter substrate-binding protein [Hydrogenibacillus sp.]